MKNYYLSGSNVNLDCLGLYPRDLLPDDPGTWFFNLSNSTSDTSFVPIHTFQADVASANPVAGEFAVSVVILSITNGECRFVLSGLDEACGTVATSAPSPTYSTSGTKLFTLSLASGSFTHLRFVIEFRRTAGKQATLTTLPNDVDSYVRAPWPRGDIVETVETPEIVERLHELGRAPSSVENVSETVAGIAARFRDRSEIVETPESLTLAGFGTGRIVLPDESETVVERVRHRLAAMREQSETIELAESVWPVKATPLDDDASETVEIAETLGAVRYRDIGLPWKYVADNYQSIALKFEIEWRAISGIVFARLVDENGAEVPESKLSTPSTTLSRVRSFDALTLSDFKTYRAQVGIDAIAGSSGEIKGAHVVTRDALGSD